MLLNIIDQGGWSKNHASVFSVTHVILHERAGRRDDPTKGGMVRPARCSPFSHFIGQRDGTASVLRGSLAGSAMLLAAAFPFL